MHDRFGRAWVIANIPGGTPAALAATGATDTTPNHRVDDSRFCS
jgi:hypothetical protein